MLSVPRAVLQHGLLSMPSRICRPALGVRLISSKDVFNLSNTTSTPLGFDIPPLPAPPPPTRSIADMVASGESVLDEMGLFQWYKPSSYFRVALEGIHTYCDIPWWTSIVAATVAMRLALIIVPIMSQKLVAKQSMYRKELDEFRSRIDDAKKENNNLLQQQIFLEQRDFMVSKDIKMGRQMLILLANGGVFATQFFAIKKMIAVNYPGLSTGGTAWFTDLTVADPYYALPIISAATIAIVSKVGIEMGASTDQMTPAMRMAMQYGMPAIVLVVSSQFASGLCVYWCASNAMSLIYSAAFRTPAIRRLFNIPQVIPPPKTAGKSKAGPLKELMANYKSSKAIPPSFSQLKERDAQQFKKAGRGKPIVK